MRGEAGAHQVRNESDEPARVVIFSTCSDPEVTVYPDEASIGVFADWSRPDRGALRTKARYPGRGS